ncbi:MAG: PAS domain S-box protein [Geobacteraceae bacterium]|nr:PAS domain S-box protein [Geobacteraceae bacterium]NTW78911.1 PAS domain S-box protein [Geobacteraceae bacterium]
MNARDHQEIRKLFDEYLRMYASRDDSLTTYFSDDFSGFTGGGDFLVKDREEWVSITRQDFAQVKDPLRIELKDLAIQSLSDSIAVTTGFFHIHLPIEDHILSRETARLVLIFRRESTGWKISHSSISIPYYLVREGEVYPLQELVERNQLLEEQVAERTLQLSEANHKLQLSNEKLANEIEEHKQSEEALRVSKEQLRVIFDTSEAGIILVSPEGRIEFGNKRMAEMFGVSVQELLGTSYPDHLAESEKHIGDDQMRQLIQGTIQSVSLERHYSRVDGTNFWGHLSGRRLENPDGSLRVLVGVIADITDRKAFENEKMKMQKLESLGILAGGIAHDFNNILTGIIGNVSLAKMFIDDNHKSYSALVGAEKASVRATELARQLLTFAKGGEPIKKTVSLLHLVNESVSLTLHGSNVKCTIDIPDSIYAIEADEGQISQVFHNIIINATQAMPGGGTLTVSARNEMLGSDNILALPPGKYSSLTFTDEGCGITEADLKKIFDPYFTTKSNGSGLGLASAHSIIHKHGGHLSVSSIVDKGTTFTIHLPSTGESISVYQTESGTQTFKDHEGGSVLVMDDEEMIRNLTAEMLEEIGYQPTTCDGGAEAIRHYKAAMEAGKSFSAVIMDLTIPGGMGGKDTAELILDLDPEACLIVSSGYSNDPIMADYSTYGFTGAIAKPYRISELEQVLRSSLPNH